MTRPLEAQRRASEGERNASVDGRAVDRNVVCPEVLDRERRWAALGHPGLTVWFTGLPASGKSTVAAAVEEQLVLAGRSAYRLDGDRLRLGLNRDLGFDALARAENVRRVAEVALVLADAGTIALVSMISPYAAGRDAARALHDEHDLRFLEVWASTPLAECERRDPKGLYARARRGELKGLTGVDDPYEPPESPELVLPGNLGVQECAQRVLALIRAAEREGSQLSAVADQPAATVAQGARRMLP